MWLFPISSWFFSQSKLKVLRGWYQSCISQYLSIRFALALFLFITCFVAALTKHHESCGKYMSIYTPAPFVCWISSFQIAQCSMWMFLHGCWLSRDSNINCLLHKDHLYCFWMECMLRCIDHRPVPVVGMGWGCKDIIVLTTSRHAAPKIECNVRLIVSTILEKWFNKNLWLFKFNSKAEKKQNEALYQRESRYILYVWTLEP